MRTARRRPEPEARDPRARPSSRHVAGPTMPSAVSPWRRCRRRTERTVSRPKTPSAGRCSARCSRRTDGPRSPRSRVGGEAVALTAQHAATSAAASTARWRRGLGTKASTLPSEILLFAGSLAAAGAAAGVSAAERLVRHVDPELPAEHALRRDLGGLGVAAQAARARRRSAAGRRRARRPRSCSSVRAPTIGATTAGCARSQASATWGTVAPWASAIACASSTARKLRSTARRAADSSRSSSASPMRVPVGGASSRR
jgi:hypothetical protein